LILIHRPSNNDRIRRKKNPPIKGINGGYYWLHKISMTLPGIGESRMGLEGGDMSARG